MIIDEQDPDVVQWGLQLFSSNPYYDCSYCSNINPNDVDYYNDQYLKDYYKIEYGNLEDDTVLDLALREHLSQLSVAETSGYVLGTMDSGAPRQGWLVQSSGNCDQGDNSELETKGEMAPPPSFTRPSEESYGNVEWSSSLDQTDEHTVDGEVGKRLNQMIPVPHVPRINGEIPSIDEATLDHQRLLDRLQVYQLVERKVLGDGNCQFRSLSDQFYRTTEHHEFVRQQVVDQLKTYPETYMGYVPMAYGDYLEKISKNGEWGDHVTLQAAADCYGVKMLVITSFKDTCYIEIVPSIQRSNRVVCLSFWAEVHYNSIYPEGE